MSVKGLSVLGTAPGVGTTTVTCALAAALHHQGQQVAVMKPIAVGCPLREDLEHEVTVGGIPGQQDAEALAALARLEALAGPPPALTTGPTPREALFAPEVHRLLQSLQIEPHQQLELLVNPYRFAPNLEPAAAARAAQVEIDLKVIQAAHQKLQRESDLMLVDGNAGILTPLSDDKSVSDMVEMLGHPVVVVAPSRPWDVINPCLLTLELLRTRGIPLAGVVLNRLERRPSVEEAVNPYQLELHAGDVVRGVLPFFELDQLDDPSALAKRLQVHVDLKQLMNPAASG